MASWIEAIPSGERGGNEKHAAEIGPIPELEYRGQAYSSLNGIGDHVGSGRSDCVRAADSKFRLRTGLPQEGWPDLSAGGPSVSLIESSQGSDLIIDPVFFQIVD